MSENLQVFIIMCVQLRKQTNKHTHTERERERERDREKEREKQCSCVCDTIETYNIIIKKKEFLNMEQKVYSNYKKKAK